MSRIMVKGLMVVATASLATACAVPDNARTGLRLGDESNGAIVWGDETPARERVIYADPIQREEYALFEKEGTRAEIVYITTRHVYNENVALDHWITLNAMINSWNYVKADRLELVDSFRADAGWIKMWAKPFRLAESNRACAGFSTEWDRASDDSDMRPGKALMGYFCSPPGRTLNEKDIVASLSGIGIRGINLAKLENATMVAALPDTPSQSELAGRVKGDGTAAAQGNPRFPFVMGVIYMNRDACTQTNDC